MITAGVVIARDPELGINSGIYRFIVKEKNLTGIDIVTPNNMRLFAQRAFERRRAAADLDLDRHPSDRDHRLRLSRAARRRRDGDRGRHPRRAGGARALLDHRHALHRRRRDRAGGGDPADRLDLAGRPLRRVHAADGRAALESAGAHQGDLDAQGRDLLQSAHAVGEHLARRADALFGDPHGAAHRRRAGQGHQRHARRLRVLARGDLDQEAAGRGQERAARRALGDGPQARRRGRRRHRRVRSDARSSGRSPPACRATRT